MNTWSKNSLIRSTALIAIGVVALVICLGVLYGLGASLPHDLAANWGSMPCPPSDMIGPSTSACQPPAPSPAIAASPVQIAANWGSQPPPP